ncbi:hypothetical protein EIP91_004468 [Steccherinum ochraceum]|uniref:Inhibitor I9 domain-containing protein n=1 Tax=Steccherinum ochraceum TaxID=92696 RepID=A0A4R0REX4_9APHY|nr:hypothetical protein EIP91_004468 [Steccherinum ochraceum]
MSDRYMVVFKNSASNADVERYITDLNSSGGVVHNKYETTIKGFSASIPVQFFERLQQDQLASDSIIDIIEPDSIVTTQ